MPVTDTDPSPTWSTTDHNDEFNDPAEKPSETGPDDELPEVVENVASLVCAELAEASVGQ